MPPHLVDTSTRSTVALSVDWCRQLELLTSASTAATALPPRSPGIAAAVPSATGLPRASLEPAATPLRFHCEPPRLRHPSSLPLVVPNTGPAELPLRPPSDLDAPLDSGRPRTRCCHHWARLSARVRMSLPACFPTPRTPNSVSVRCRPPFANLPPSPQCTPTAVTSTTRSGSTPAPQRTRARVFLCPLST